MYKIDEGTCIDCGVCKKTCAFQRHDVKNKDYNLPEVYAARHRDNEVLKNSSSGGAFTAISDFVLENSGVVYGVSFDEKFNLVYKKAETKKERDKFRGSKYSQSSLKDTFIDVKKDLERDVLVLFVGTPCQVDGLKSFLGNRCQDNLILCDLVCHGASSPLIWQEHIKSIKKYISKNINSYKFRDKNYGWRGVNVTLQYDNTKNQSNTNLLRTYSNLYFQSLITRPSCHNCKYTNLNRVSDITIGDFWGIEKCMPEFDDNKGMSLILVNTEKGTRVFNSVKHDLIYKKSNVDDCLQPQLQHPDKPSLNRKYFWGDYKNKGYNYVIKKYAGYGFKNKVKSIVIIGLQKSRLINFLKK